MYVKYVIGSSSTAAETARDILNIILGNYTSLSDLQAEGTGTTIEGTGPTSGTYHTPFIGSGSAWSDVTAASDDHFTILKKHVQYSTLAATQCIRVFGHSGQPFLALANPSSRGTAWPNGSAPAGNSQITVPHAAGNVIHLIVNDTTLAMGAVQTTNSTATANHYHTSCVADFEVTPYDTAALAKDSNYYPGCLWVSGSEAPTDNNHQVASAQNPFMIGRYKAWHINDDVHNTFYGATSTSSMFHQARSSYANTLNKYPCMIPDQSSRMPLIPSGNGASPALVPLMYHPTSHLGAEYDASTNVHDHDTRYHGVMLNCFRTTDSIGQFGDVVKLADNTEFIIMRGQRTSPKIHASTNEAYHPTCYCFPKNNVGV